MPMSSLGQMLDKQTPICFVHAKNEDDFQRAQSSIKAALIVSSSKPETVPVLYKY